MDHHPLAGAGVVTKDQVTPPSVDRAVPCVVEVVRLDHPNPITIGNGPPFIAGAGFVARANQLQPVI